MNFQNGNLNIPAIGGAIVVKPGTNLAKRFGAVAGIEGLGLRDTNRVRGRSCKEGLRSKIPAFAQIEPNAVADQRRDRRHSKNFAEVEFTQPRKGPGREQKRSGGNRQTDLLRQHRRNQNHISVYDQELHWMCRRDRVLGAVFNWIGSADGAPAA